MLAIRNIAFTSVPGFQGLKITSSTIDSVTDSRCGRNSLLNSMLALIWLT